MTQFFHRFRCQSCPCVREAHTKAQLPTKCPVCGAEQVEQSQVVRKDERPFKPAQEMQDRRH